MDPIQIVMNSPWTTGRFDELFVFRAAGLSDHHPANAVRPHVSTQNFGTHVIAHADQLIPTACEHFGVIHNARLTGGYVDNNKLDLLYRSLRYVRAARLTLSTRHPTELRSSRCAGRIVFGIRNVSGDQLVDPEELAEAVLAEMTACEQWVQSLFDARYVEIGGILVNVEDAAAVEGSAPFEPDAAGEMVSARTGEALTRIILGKHNYGKRWSVPKNSLDYRRHKITQAPASMKSVQIPVGLFEQFQERALDHQIPVDQFVHDQLIAAGC